MGIFQWLKNSAKVKRWLLVILIGITLMCIAVAQMISLNVVDVTTVLFTIIEFTAGLATVIFGIIKMQKRTLEIFIEANGVYSSELEKKNIQIDSLIFDKNIYENGPKVVVIGGGAGVDSVIKGLKRYTSNITVVVTISDNYGTKDEETPRYLNLPPYGTIKKSIASLSENESFMKKLMYHEFTSEKLEGLNFGDIYLLAMQEITGNLSTAIKRSTEALNAKGEVVPASLDEITICAELLDGTIVKKKAEIPKVVLEKREPIQRVYIEPTNARPTPRVIEAIEDADIIVVAPGNLYTEIIPNMIVKNIAQTIKRAKAKKVYVANIMTDEGQTDEYNLSEHIKAIKEHLNDNVFDYCLADTGDIMPEYIRMYHKKGTDLVNVDADVVKKLGTKVIQRDFSKIEDGKIRHDSEAVALAIMQIALADMKYEKADRKVTTTALQAVLNEQKRIQKKKQKALEKANKKLKGKEKTKEKSLEYDIEKEIEKDVRQEKKIGKRKFEEERKKELLEKEKERERERENLALNIDEDLNLNEESKEEQSKFLEKYTQRIQTIREIDAKKEEEDKKMFQNFFKMTRAKKEKAEKEKEKLQNFLLRMNNEKDIAKKEKKEERKIVDINTMPLKQMQDTMRITAITEEIIEKEKLGSTAINKEMYIAEEEKFNTGNIKDFAKHIENPESKKEEPKKELKEPKRKVIPIEDEKGEDLLEIKEKKEKKTRKVAKKKEKDLAKELMAELAKLEITRKPKEKK